MGSAGYGSSAHASSTAKRREPPIDENVLDGLHRLSRDSRPDLAKTVIMLFLETAPTTLGDLQRGAAARDTGMLSRASHILGASSIAVGAVPLSACCKELEAAARTGRVPDAAGRVRVIQRLYAEAEGALRACVWGDNRVYLMHRWIASVRSWPLNGLAK